MEEEKTTAEKQRESIQVTTSKATETDETEAAKEAEVAKEEETIEAKVDEDNNDKDNEGEKEEEKEEVEAKEDDVDPEKLKRTIARLQKRLDKETGSKKDLKKELEAAQAKLSATESVLTEEDVETRATQKAREIAAAKDFERACNKLNKEALAVDKTFDKKVSAMAEDIGPIPGQMIGVLDDLDNGGAVLNYLTDNLDEAEEIYGLSAAKMAVKLAKISTTLIDKATKTRKEISKIPPPAERLDGKGNSSSSTIITGKETMDDFVRKRNAQVEQRRKDRIARMG